MSNEESTDEISPEFRRFLILLKKPKISRRELHECVSYLADELVSLKIEVTRDAIANLERYKKFTQIIANLE